MAKHPRRKHSGKKENFPSNPFGSKAPIGFWDAWNQLLSGWDGPSISKRRGRKPTVPLSQLLPALVFHFMNGAGTLAQHFFQLVGTTFADSSWSDRRMRLPWEVFEELMQRALRPVARPREHRHAFWRGWRVMALDGVQFSLSNTPRVLGVLKKRKTRRGLAGFAKISASVLLEIGLHNPVAAAIGRKGEAEWELTQRMLQHLPKGVLLLADRLHGCGAFAVQAVAVCQAVGSHFLFRARSNVKRRVLKRFKDGSRLIEVSWAHRLNPKRVSARLKMREIRARVGRKGYRSQNLCLWTSLSDPHEAPGLELAQVYAQRWEHELYFRQLKRQLRRTDLLQSYTVETGAQEIAALLLASSLLAIERARAAAGQQPVLRLSFAKVLELLRPLWLTLELGQDLLSERQKDQFVQRFYEQMRRCLTPKRRFRSCPRAVRKTTKKWPRLKAAWSVTGPFELKAF